MHVSLRFAVGIALSFVVCEAMSWKPAYLTPILTGALLANLPGRPPLKLGLIVILSMTVSAAFAWLLSTLLLDMQWVLFGAISLCLFVTFLAMLTAGPAAAFPATLMLMCLSTIPVVAMAYPSQAAQLPKALVRSMILAMITIWLVYAIWPRSAPPQPTAPPPPTTAPVATALLATGIVIPLMLGFLLLAPADALVVLVNTVLMVANFDPRLSLREALRRVAGNAIGGVFGLLAYWIFLIHPSLITLGLIMFILSFLIGMRIAEGRQSIPPLVFGMVGMLIIFGSLILSGPGNPGIWITRVTYIILAGAFAVGAMNLVWHWLEPIAERRAESRGSTKQTGDTR
jgi:hypothetical protein